MMIVIIHQSHFGIIITSTVYEGREREKEKPRGHIVTGQRGKERMKK
jgi:hypothetical protein